MFSTLISYFLLFLYLFFLGITAEEDFCFVGKKIISGDVNKDSTKLEPLYDDMVCRISASSNRDCTQVEFEMSIDKRKTSFCRTKGLPGDMKISCDCVGELEPCNSPKWIFSVLSSKPLDFPCLRKRLLQNLYSSSDRDIDLEFASFLKNNEKGKKKKLVATRDENGHVQLLHLLTTGNIDFIMGPSRAAVLRNILPVIWIACLTMSLYSLYFTFRHWLPRFLQTY